MIKPGALAIISPMVVGRLIACHLILFVSLISSEDLVKFA